MLVIKLKTTGEIIAKGAEDKNVRQFEGHWYFVPEVVNTTYLKVTDRTYTCPYKGVCYWIDLEAPGVYAKNIAWVYRQPQPGYEFIKDQLGFYARDTSGTKAVEVTGTEEIAALNYERIEP
jgi:uncharacterized protein (DUF427 family)